MLAYIRGIGRASWRQRLGPDGDPDGRDMELGASSSQLGLSRAGDCLSKWGAQLAYGW